MALKVTIGICAYNEEKGIAKALHSALNSKPKVLEVIAVASGCTDGTLEIIKKMQKKDRRLKLMIEKERKGKGSAVNLILKNAKGTIIVMTDADLTFNKKAVSELLKKFQKNVGCVSGRVQYYAEKEPFKTWAGYASQAYHESRMEREKTGFTDITGYLYAVKKGIVERIPPKAKSEDAFMGLEVTGKGWKIAYAPKAIASVHYPENLKDFIAQKTRTRYGHLEALNANESNPISGIAKMRGSALKKYFKEIASFGKDHRKALLVTALGFLEVLSWANAMRKFHLKTKEEWKKIESTK